MSTFNVANQWILLDGCGDTVGVWIDRPTDTTVEERIEGMEEGVEPFVLVEATRKAVWDGDPYWDGVHRVDMTVPGPAPVTPVQSGPRKVIIR